MALGNLQLTQYQLPPLIVKLEDGRNQVTLRWEAPVGMMSVATLESLIFDSYGTLLGASFGGNTPPAIWAYVNCVLVKQETRMPHRLLNEPEPQNSHIVLEKIYEFASTTTISTSSTSPQVGVDQYETGPDGRQEIIAVYCNQTASTYTPGVVGTDTHNGGVLRTEKVEVSYAVRKVTRRYVVSGIIQAQRHPKQDGTQEVYFLSIGSTKIVPTALNSSYTIDDPADEAYQGGATTPLIQDNIRDIAGCQTFEVTAIMKYDGTALSADEPTQIVDYDDYIDYEYPGTVTADLLTIWEVSPGVKIKVLANIAEFITTDSNPGGAPFFIQAYAYGNATYIPPSANNPVIIAKGFRGFLSGGSIGVVGDATVAGQAGCTEVNITVVSTPSASDFAALTDFAIENRLAKAFVDAATGTQYYRHRTVTIGSWPSL